jgi:hypothetical protein
MSAIAVSSGRMRWYLLTAVAALALGGSAHAEESWCPNAAPTCDWQEWYAAGVVARAEGRAAEMSSEAEQVLEAVEKYPPGVPIRDDFALSYSWTNFNETYLTDRLDGTNMKWSMKVLRSFVAGPLYSSDTIRYALKSRVAVINESLRYYNRLWKQKGGQGDMPGYDQEIMDFSTPSKGWTKRPASLLLFNDREPCRALKASGCVARRGQADDHGANISHNARRGTRSSCAACNR